MVVLVLSVVYALALLGARKVWLAIPEATLQPEPYVGEPLGIVVVARNEARNLPALFKSLAAQQSVPFHLYLVNDNSTDATQALAENWQQQQYFPLTIYQLPAATTSPKKEAIDSVVRRHSHPYWVVTDADCVAASPNWLAHHAQAYQQGYEFASAPVVYNSGSSFANLQKLEFMALVAVGGISVYQKQAGMCNAANMSFSRAAFLAVNGYAGNERLPTGDDEFLLAKLAQAYPEKLKFILNPEAKVRTEASPSLNVFLNQRKRWAGKWRFKPGRQMLAPLALFLFYLLWAVGLVLWPGAWAVAGLVLKAGADYIFLRAVARRLAEKINFLTFLILLLVYPIYVLFFGIIVNWGTYRWKGRQYRISPTPTSAAP